MTVATATAVEIVAFAPESIRARGWFDALARGAAAAGIDVTRGDTYRGQAPWLLLWGPGEPTRRDTIRTHVAAGGRCIALDLAYWDRNVKARVSFDAPHPQAWVMRRPLPRDRFLAEKVPVVDGWNSCGPIIIAGLGDKARVQYGADQIDAWETAMMRQCRERWPDRRVFYRKKKPTSHVPGWAQLTSGPSIEQALTGASLLITWHSNVAVDAIRLGIPVICRDGAASAVCPSALTDDPRPLPPAVRDQFLWNLAWFQWAPTEATAFWRFVLEALA